MEGCNRNKGRPARQQENWQEKELVGAGADTCCKLHIFLYDDKKECVVKTETAYTETEIELKIKAPKLWSGGGAGIFNTLYIEVTELE